LKKDYITGDDYMKRRTLTISAVIIIMAGVYIITPGYFKNGNADITDYSVSADGTEMTIKVEASSGHIRKVAESQQHGGRLYLDSYYAFGGFNGTIGAKDEYTIQLDEDTEMIAVYRNTNCYEPVLEKNADGKWERA